MCKWFHLHLHLVNCYFNIHAKDILFFSFFCAPNLSYNAGSILIFNEKQNKFAVFYLLDTNFCLIHDVTDGNYWAQNDSIHCCAIFKRRCIRNRIRKQEIINCCARPCPQEQNKNNDSKRAAWCSWLWLAYKQTN